MIRWGISAGYHDASISVLDDDDILFGGHAERYSGIKNDKNLNQEIVDDALQYGYPDKIYWYERPWIKNIRRLYAGQKLKRNDIKNQLSAFGIKAPIKYTTHHRAHAAAGLYTSPFQDSSALVIDAIGELTTTSIWTNNRKRWSQWYPKSLGLFYSAMTDKVGLKPLEDEYILMGMAAYGDPDVLYSKIRNLYDSGFNFHKGCDLQLNTQSGFDIAAATQKIYEEDFR